MNVREFLKLTYTPSRKLLAGSASIKDINILSESYKRIILFYRLYLKKYKKEMSEQQQNIIIALIQKMSQHPNFEVHNDITNLIASFSSIGVNYVVRHPEPLIESYAKDLEASKTLSIRGIWQVHKFNKYLIKILNAYPGETKVKLYYSEKYRTELFAKLIAKTLHRLVPVQVASPSSLNSLYAKVIPEMKIMYPEVKNAMETLPWSKKLKILRKYFKMWVIESSSAKETAATMQELLMRFEPFTFNIYITHENVIAPYLYHTQKFDVESAFVGTGRYVRSVPGHVFVQY